MNASDFLAGYGISVDQAREWIMSNLDNPQTIYDVAVSLGVTSSMLAEIVAPVVPGVDAALVESFFSSYGLDGSALEETYTTIMTEEMAELTNLVTMNTHTGILSTASLRTAVLAQVSNDDDYWAMFTPTDYAGSEDGIFTAEELGIGGMSSFEATAENLESLYYGTLINTYQAIDMSEMMEIQTFVATHEAALAAGSAAVVDAYMDLMVSVFEDPANPPIFPDAALRDVIVTATAAAVELVGSGGSDAALFDSLMSGFMGA